MRLESIALLCNHIALIHSFSGKFLRTSSHIMTPKTKTKTKTKPKQNQNQNQKQKQKQKEPRRLSKVAQTFSIGIKNPRL